MNTQRARSAILRALPHDAHRIAAVYARIALAAGFLSAVASRFGIWDRTIDRGHFQRFLDYTAQVNSFMPAASIPFLAWAATACETLIGLALLIGIKVRFTALCASILLLLFGTAMAISFGPKSPLDYSVFSASAAALLLRYFDQGEER